MRVRPVSLVATLALAGSATLAGLSYSAAAQDGVRDFDGWVVQFEGLEERFPAGDGWTGVALRDGYQLTRLGVAVTYHGSFRVERSSKVAPNYARGPKEDLGDGWSVWQAGTDRYYSRTEGWMGRANADGWYLERRGQSVWYYGSFRVTARSKDLSGR